MTPNRLKSFKFRGVLCRIRFLPTFISKMKWLGSGLPLTKVRQNWSLIFSERIYNLDHVVSFCVCANLICVIETNNRNFPKYSNEDTDYRSADSDSDSMKSDSSNNNSLHASSIKVFSLHGLVFQNLFLYLFETRMALILKYHKSKFLYSLQLYDISLQFDPADQPIRLFQREKDTDSILLVIERENNLLPVRMRKVPV